LIAILSHLKLKSRRKAFRWEPPPMMIKITTEKGAGKIKTTTWTGILFI
jgi:hypothetical protein